MNKKTLLVLGMAGSLFLAGCAQTPSQEKTDQSVPVEEHKEEKPPVAVSQPHGGGAIGIAIGGMIQMILLIF